MEEKYFFSEHLSSSMVDPIFINSGADGNNWNSIAGWIPVINMVASESTRILVNPGDASNLFTSGSVSIPVALRAASNLVFS